MLFSDSGRMQLARGLEGTTALICSLATRQTLKEAGAKVASGPEIVPQQVEMPVEGEAGSLSESFQAELIRCEK